MTGASDAAVGEERVTEALKRVGFPHDGQNFFELSLHILILHETRVRVYINRNSLEAGMTPQNPRLDLFDPLALQAHEVETHLKENVLHGEISGHTSSLDDLVLLFLAVCIESGIWK